MTPEQETAAGMAMTILFAMGLGVFLAILAAGSLAIWGAAAGAMIMKAIFLAIFAIPVLLGVFLVVWGMKI